MRIAIVGSRDFGRPELVEKYVHSLPADTVVIVGGARGVDRWAENFARARGMAVELFPADWVRYGKEAGFRRNRQMVTRADKVIAFWDGKSRGTQHSIELARTAGKLDCLITETP